MAKFDYKTYLRSAGRGDPFLTSIGLAFGFPSCILTLSAGLLKLIPSSILKWIRGDAKRSQDRADDVIKRINSWNRWVTGILEFETGAGTIGYMSDTSQDGIDQDETKNSSALGRLLDLVQDISQLAGNIYTNYENANALWNSIKDCLRQFKNYKNLTGGLAADTRQQLDPNLYDDSAQTSYNASVSVIQDAVQHYTQVGQLISNIDAILAERVLDPTLEPQFSPELCLTLSGLGLNVACPTPAEPVDGVSSVFRLVFGPPKSSTGQFILSRDGLYFDSQSSGITPALVEVADKASQISVAEKWKFNYSPNIGGRGDKFSTEDINLYFNTILDPNIIDESEFFQTYYEKDGLLQDLIGQRSKRIYDLSAQIEDLVSTNTSQSVIFNFKQSLMSENSTHQDRINKRKKQIELAVKLPSIYGNQNMFAPGEVPVNDFSYLEGINLVFDIQKQKALTLSQVDISSVIYPVTTATYVVSPKHSKNTAMEHLIIANLGDGAIIYDGSSVSATNAVILDVENSLTTDRLFAMYNFLQTDIEEPSSTKFMLRNSASMTDEGYAQLVGDSLQSVFYRGLGVPYLHGITRNSQSLPTYPSGLGSYVKLPDTNEFNDLLYNPDGATIDFWVHTPSLNTIDGYYDIGNVSSLYRLVLANENVGYAGTTTNTNTENVTNSFSDNVVRGFVMGFTRDRRLTSNASATNVSNDNITLSSAFFIAPTQSVNSSSVAFLNRSYYDIETCISGTNYHCMIQPINIKQNGVSFSSCESEFCHVAVTFDRVKDEISFYLDGRKTTTSSMSYVFGIPKYSMPNIPTFKKSNSFEYNVTSVGPYAPADLAYGPKLNTYFTPWIVGGGYTDGMYSRGNFMGGTYGGISSGLKGYVGSLKFYKKPLNEDEVSTNFKTQKNFFKNIDTISVGWGLVI